MPTKLTTRLKQVCGNAVILSTLVNNLGFSKKSRKQILIKRDQRLRELIGYAAASVPYYRKFFNNAGIDVRDIRSADDLKYLPIINKELVRKNPSDFVSSSFRGKTSIPFRTSGTTGQPMTVYHDQLSLLKNIVYGEREREPLTKAMGKSLGYRETLLSYPGSTVSNVWNFYDETTFVPVRPKRQIISVFDSFETNIDAINRFKPDCIVGLGSYLEMLFKKVANQGLSLHIPEFITYSVDTMTPEGKRFIEENFNIPVFSRYNAVEAFKIAYTCENRNGFHIHEDLCHIRIIDDKGADIRPGDIGHALISNLVNHGTVLLNYRMGDMAAISEETCSCGRPQSILKNLGGRTEDMLFLDGGDFIHPRMIWKIFSSRNEVLQYQVIQHERNRFELKLVTNDRHTYERLIDDIARELKLILGNTAVLTTGFYTRLDCSSAGKFRPVMSMIHGLDSPHI